MLWNTDSYRYPGTGTGMYYPYVVVFSHHLLMALSSLFRHRRDFLRASFLFFSRANKPFGFFWKFEKIRKYRRETVED